MSLRARRGEAQAYLRQLLLDPPPTDMCVEWPYARQSKRGYGVIRHGSRCVRVMRILANATNAQVVRHSCDNPPCVNPRHLSVGTQGDNLRDRRNRGRAKFYGRAPILTEPDVRQILASELPARALATRYGVSESAIYEIRARRAWRHV